MSKVERAKARAVVEGTSFAEAFVLNAADDVARERGVPFRDALLSACGTYPKLARQADALKQVDRMRGVDARIRALRALGEEA